MERADVQRWIKQEKVISTVVGKITDLHQIGEGGNGLVYKGKLQGFDIAAKLLVNEDKEKKDRFLAEYINILITCDSKHISKYLGYDEVLIQEERIPCIMMKLYNQTLKEYRKNDSSIPSTIFRLFEHLCDVLEEIHRHGVVHRDIKPENIFVDGQNFILGDYGLAKFDTETFELAGMSKTGERLGNNVCSAPEQIDKPYKAATPASDIYTLAKIIYWYATGEWVREIPSHRISEVVKTDRTKDIVALERIVMLSLNHDMEKRPQTIQELREKYNDIRDELSEINPFDDFEIINDAMRSSSPDCHLRFYHMVDQKEIIRFVSKIQTILPRLKCPFYFSNGWENNEISSIKMMDNGNLVLNGFEYIVHGIWLYASDNLFDDMIIMDIENHPDYIINGETTISKLIVDGKEYPGRYYDAGYLPIGDDVVPVCDLDFEYIQVGQLQYRNVLIGSFYSSFLHESIDPYTKKELGNVSLTKEHVMNFYYKYRKNHYREVRIRF